MSIDFSEMPTFPGYCVCVGGVSTDPCMCGMQNIPSPHQIIPVQVHAQLIMSE